MKKFIALTTKEKQLKINGKMMTDFLQALYSVCKKLGQFFLHSIRSLIYRKINQFCSKL